LRLIHEYSDWEKAGFVTLTYAVNPVGLVPKDFQLFFKRLRRSVEGKIKYFACGEYGDKRNRPHYHAIVFGIGPNALDRELVRDSWGLGRTQVGSVTVESCNYVAGYIRKKFSGPLGKEVYGELEPPFLRCSQGIGLAWAERNESYLINKLGCTLHGEEYSLPRYYRKKFGDKISEERLEQNRLLKALPLDEAIEAQGVPVLEEWKFRHDLRLKKHNELEARLARRKPKFGGLDGYWDDF